MWIVIRSAPACETPRRSGPARRSSDARPAAAASTRRTASTIGMPKLRLGTKWPSMMSRWRIRAPASSSRRISSASATIESQQRRPDQRGAGVQCGNQFLAGHRLGKLPATYRKIVGSRTAPRVRRPASRLYRSTGRPRGCPAGHVSNRSILTGRPAAISSLFWGKC